jgi:hypothetical protein
MACSALAPVVAAPNAQAEIFRLVRAFEVVGGESYLTPGATLELADEPRTSPYRKRLWRHVPGSGVIFERRVRRMTIAHISKDRAIVDARTAARVYYHSVGMLEYSGVTHELSDRLELQHNGNRWLINSVVRRVRTIGTDTAWRQRQAKKH